MAEQVDMEELITWLESDEAASRESRAFRLKHLLDVVQPPENGICFQGETSLQAFEEAKKARLKDLLSKAHREGMISVQELDTLHHLRSIRNSQTHFHPPGVSSSMLSRTVNQNMLPNEVFKKDAEEAIEALGRFFKERGLY